MKVIGVYMELDQPIVNWINREWRKGKESNPQFTKRKVVQAALRAAMKKK